MLREIEEPQIPSHVKKIAIVTGEPTPFGPYKILEFVREQYWKPVSSRPLRAGSYSRAKKEAEELLGIVGGWGDVYAEHSLLEGDWIELK